MRILTTDQTISSRTAVYRSNELMARPWDLNLASAASLPALVLTRSGVAYASLARCRKWVTDYKAFEDFPLSIYCSHTLS